MTPADRRARARREAAAHSRPDWEREYRRGYLDGWMAAASAMLRLTGERGRDGRGAYSACFTHWQVALFDWRTEDCKQALPPPALGDK